MRNMPGLEDLTEAPGYSSRSAYLSMWLHSYIPDKTEFDSPGVTQLVVKEYHLRVASKVANDGQRCICGIKWSSDAQLQQCPAC